MWLVDHAYGADFPTALPAREGKNMGWTDWTHDRATRPRTRPGPLEGARGALGGSPLPFTRRSRARGGRR